MSIDSLYILLETHVNSNNMRSDFSSSGSSNPQNENGSILQGLDDPLEVSRVSFNDVVEEFSASLESTMTSVPQLTDEGRLSYIDFHTFDYYYYLDDDTDIYIDNVRAYVDGDQVVYEVQSGVARQHGIGEAQTEQVLMTILDDTAQVEDQFITDRDDTYYVADVPEVDIKHFFQRPVRLATFSWTVGTLFPSTDINPYQLFWSNPKVVNRLANNRYMKSDMCVKFLINGTPFHYGLLMASLSPNAAADQTMTAFVDNNNNQGVLLRSQRPHIMLDPTTSQGGCLRVPFLQYNNAFNMSVTANDVSASTLINIRQVVPLRHVSGIVEPITITVLGWAENVVLSGPTLLPVAGLVPQSGDEYGQGVVSRPAYILAKIASRLTAVPYIGPYALATKIGATSLGTVAKIFGYSKPSVVSDIAIMNRRQLPNFASSTQHDPIFKATFDDKQEVTVDPRVVGLTGEDEMTLASIVQRETILTSFVWTQVGITDTRLFQVKVSPCLFDNLNPAPNMQFYMTPMCWASMAFRSWRGSIKYRFRAVASSFHRGRLKIVYDPGVMTGNADFVSGNNHNLQYMYVWDLSESKEAVIEVGWNTNMPYLRVSDPASNIGATTFPFSTSAVVAGNIDTDPLYDNGLLAVYVMNELTAPSVSATADVSVVVSVAASDDFELFDPTDQNYVTYKYNLQSGEDMEDTHYRPYMAKVNATFGNKCINQNVSIIHHGDPVTSLRTILKRYVYTMTVGTQDNANVNVDITVPAFPLYPGKVGGAVHLAAGGTVPYNYTAMTHLNWFTPAFLARRGGLRNRFVPTSTRVRNAVIGRSYVGTYGYNVSLRTQPVGTSEIPYRSLVDRGFGLNTLFRGGNASPSSDSVLDIETPYHSFQRFFNGRTYNIATNLVNEMGINLRYGCYGPIPTVGEGGIAGFDRYVSAADDFSLAVFVNVPVVFGQPSFLAV